MAFHRFAPVAIASLLFLNPICLHAEDPKKIDVEDRLQGRWELVAGVNQGRKLAPAELAGTYVTVATNTIATYDRNQKQRFNAVFSVDAEKTPVEITMTTVPEGAPTNSPGEPVTVTEQIASGILKFSSEDKWTLCYALPGADRPKNFKSPRGSKILLFEFVRSQGDPVPEASTIDPTKTENRR